MASVEPDTDSASSVTQNNSSSSEFHENLASNSHKYGNLGGGGLGSTSSRRGGGDVARFSGTKKSVPPDFIPIRSSWRSSSVHTRDEEDDEEDEDSTSTNANDDSPLAGSKISDLRDREIRGETGSMKESKTFAFGLKHFTEGDIKGR